uniref:Uncharacterized protein n=1 Tax=Ipomoea trifida TaxID=35884 RepID=A0A900_IPOTF|nr:hypothetical protein [Ipomoea trifida]
MCLINSRGKTTICTYANYTVDRGPQWIDRGIKTTSFWVMKIDG